MLYPVGEHSGIYCIEGAGEARVYFLTQPEPILIDAGAPGGSDRIVRDLASLGVRPLDIKKILVTHHHEDHVGGLWDLQRRSGARIFAHPRDAEYISGRRARRAHRKGPLGAVSALLGPTCRPVMVNGRLTDGDEIAGLRVIHTPGHTPGHVCFLSGEVLFSGDLLDASPGGFAETPLLFTDDVATARESIRRVAELSFRAILPGHRAPYVFRADERVRELAQKLGQSVESNV